MPEFIQEYLRHIRIAGHEKTTIATKKYLLYRWRMELGKNLLHVTTEEWVNVFDQPRWEQATRRAYYAHADAFYTWAIQTGHLLASPLAPLPKPRSATSVPRPASNDDVSAGLNLGAPWGMFVALAAYAGLRCIEIARLHSKDIAGDSMRVLGKGGTWAYVPMHPIVAERIAGINGWIAGPITHARSPATYLSSTAGKVLREAGIPVTMHQYRHWFGTTLLRIHRNLRVVQELMRHTSIQSTMLYTLIESEERKAAVAELPRLDNNAPITTNGVQALDTV